MPSPQHCRLRWTTFFDPRQHCDWLISYKFDPQQTGRNWGMLCSVLSQHFFSEGLYLFIPHNSSLKPRTCPLVQCWCSMSYDLLRQQSLFLLLSMLKEPLYSQQICDDSSYNSCPPQQPTALKATNYDHSHIFMINNRFFFDLSLTKSRHQFPFHITILSNICRYMRIQNWILLFQLFR